ncbi:GNAT family N-acetyltransferase [Streptomyces griseoluteus]|uniref:GNAT family N-acetyltransferase n=1 Tax=Streptomyces griseoluteus TaxID=29306 RepID=UPI0033DE78CB
MPYLTSPVLPEGTLSRRPQPEIPAGAGLRLRPWRAEDASAVHAAFQDPTLNQWHARSCDSPEEAAGWIEDWHAQWTRECDAQWAVVRADTGELCGRAALREIRLRDGVAEVAYWTVASARGQGVARHATEALVRWSFDEIGFNRLELMHATANEASCRVATKAGFAVEGTRRRALLHPDGWHDMHLHARLGPVRRIKCG